MAFLRGSSIYCIRKIDIDKSQRETFSSVCITTATISSFGAIVQLVNWSKRMRRTEYRRIPSPTPHVVFSLALADLFTCIGAIAMSILFISWEPPIKHENDEHVKPPFDHYVQIGMPIESFTMFSYICSYLWTLSYSVDICLQVHGKCLNGKVYHVLTWPVAAWLVGCIEFAVFSSDPIYCSTGIVALLHYSVCYIPLCVVMLGLPFIYWKAYRKVSQNIKRTGYFTDTERKMQKSVRKKFCLIVSVFVFCWLLNFIDGFHDIYDYSKHENTFENDAKHAHFVIWMIEASINPLQGFLNCLVYGQHRQFATCCSHIMSLGRSDSTRSPDSGRQNRNREWAVNSYSTSIKIPVNDVSPLLSGSKHSTPTVSTPSKNSPREPFSARLLGEFSRQ